MSKVAIVCVDDDNTVLESLKMQLTRYYDSSFILEYAESGQDALELVDQLKANGVINIVIVCDFNLGDSSGDRVLSAIHQKYPDIVKLLLSGFIPPEIIDTLTDSINLKGYIYKPWDSQNLIEAIDSAVRSTPEFSNGCSDINDYKINNTAAICVIGEDEIHQKITHRLRQINCGMYEVISASDTVEATIAAEQLASSGVRHLVIAANWGRPENDLVIDAVSKFVSVKVIVLNGNSEHSSLMNGMIKGIELAKTFDGISCIETTCSAIDNVAKKCYSVL